MKRDMDYVRALLLQIEGGKKMFQTAPRETGEMLGIPPEELLNREEADKLSGHLKLLEDEDFIKITLWSTTGAVTIDRLTSRGHDFLDAARGK